MGLGEGSPLRIGEGGLEDQGQQLAKPPEPRGSPDFAETPTITDFQIPKLPHGKYKDMNVLKIFIGQDSFFGNVMFNETWKGLNVLVTQIG